MMTPQEVASHAFTRATLGGYNMSMVDEFLDALTEDYTTLYNDNAILKTKLKVLSDTIEEYRATDDAMRKTLLAAQRMADSMVSDAESKKAQLVRDAEEAARRRITELQAEITAEEYRLQAAQESTAAYVAELVKLFEGQRDFLSNLSQMTPKVRDAEVHVGGAASDIGDAMSQITAGEDEPLAPQPDGVQEEDGDWEDEEEYEEDWDDEEEYEDEEEDGGPSPNPYDGDDDDTREFRPDAAPASARFDDLKFGRDYEIT